MKNLLLTAFAIALSVTTAAAQVSIPSGAWSAYRDKTSDSKTICGMQTYFPAAKASIFVKFIEGDDRIRVHMMKDSWRFPSDHSIDIQLTVGFDGYSQVVNARGGVSEKGYPMVEFSLTSGIDEFLRQFGDANYMWIEYPQGDEPRWSARMIGSRKAAMLFKVCTLAVLDQMSARKPTQPYGSAPAKPTQPFGSAKQPTQPIKQPPSKNDDGSI
ncbi:hypothetical protein [Bradyrhizobium sp. WSM1743]|uniref:hypothetical protein n=1 Tax=Bradyrhizobium sp. WSM1743 TaxID=318996 RepID=UPI00041947A1|nr:hypothetical protein [Bradyrhizobium sp. WSM1743]